MYKKAFLLTLVFVVAGVFSLSVSFIFFGDSKVTNYVKSNLHSAGIIVPSLVLQDDGSVNIVYPSSYTDPAEYFLDSEDKDTKLIEYNKPFIDVYYDTTKNHFNKDLNTDFSDWHWTKDVVIADVIGIELGNPVVGVRVSFPADKQFSKKLLAVPLSCPKKETSVVSSLNLNLVNTNVDVYEHVNKGDIIYSRCGDSKCSFFDYGCVLVKRANNE